MAMIKRTSPGPKIGPTGSSIGAPKSIGTTGKDKTSTSSAGGQYPFLPGAKSTPTTAKHSSGQSASGRQNFHDFMPMKAGGKK